MANVFVSALVLICIATGSQAQPAASHQELPGQMVQVDFVFDNAVRKTRDLPTAALRVARKKMISGGTMRFTELRALADAGDGLAAFRFAKLLQERNIADPTGTAAHYYAISAYTGRDFAVPPLARLLKKDGAGYSASRLTQCLSAMTVQAQSGNPVAAMLLGRMYADGAPFGYDPAKAETFLSMTPGRGSPQAVLQLGVALMSDPEDAANGHPGARSALSLAAAGDDLAVRVTAENLLKLIDALPKPEVTE